MKAVAIVLALALFSCSKDDSGEIPYAYVDYRITTQEFGIRNKDGVLVVNGQGVAGLVIYKNGTSYVAFDRCSSVNPEKRCAVTPDPASFTLVDSCSGAKFLLLDGSPAKAPATKNLRQYAVTITNNSQIQVSN